jgi:hypothetical protein
MLKAGIQAGSELDPRLKHSGVTPLSQISSPNSDTPQLAAELFVFEIRASEFVLRKLQSVMPFVAAGVARIGVEEKLFDGHLSFDESLRMAIANNGLEIFSVGFA